MHLHVPHLFDKNENRARLFLNLRKLVTGLTSRKFRGLQKWASEKI